MHEDYGPRPTPAQPLPSRSGLMLSGEVKPQAAALGRLPAAGARSAAETGEALGQLPQRLIEKVRNAEEVTPALKNPRPDYYDTGEQAWQRDPQPGSGEDLAETRSLQEQIRDQFDAEQRGRLSRGTEEGFARNTRPRTSKSELQGRFASASRGAQTAGKSTAGQTLIERARAALAPQPEPQTVPADEDLLPLLTESLRLARLKR